MIIKTIRREMPAIFFFLSLAAGMFNMELGGFLLLASSVALLSKKLVGPAKPVYHPPIDPSACTFQDTISWKEKNPDKVFSDEDLHAIGSIASLDAIELVHMSTIKFD